MSPSVKPVRFLKGWNGHAPGTIVPGLPSGVAVTLVERNFAEYVEQEPETGTRKRAKRNLSGKRAASS